MTINSYLVLGIDAVLIVSALGLLVLSIVLFVECIAALFAVPSQVSQDDWQNTKVTVLVPAHNEEVVIRSTLLEIKSQLQKQHRLVVIADNCHDATAEIAGAVGATVIERHDLSLIGKGYALDCGLRFLESEPPDIVIFIDADCKVEQGAIEQLIQYAIATKRPVQATYLMSKPSSSNPKASVSAFAFKVKNLVRPLGLAQLKMPCLLTGTGMAFPWSVISTVDLANGYIVEDMKLGLDLTIAGHIPVFCPQANVTALLPQQAQATKSQRTRWEHGHLKSLLSYVPVLLKASIKQKRLDLLISALDMCVPPLSLLVFLWLLLTAVSWVFGVFTALWIPVTFLATAGLFLLIAILGAWVKFGRTDLPLQELLTVPFYVIWKIPIYLKFLVQPQNKWIRTERDSVNISKP
ncbi:glycosyltransferase family 2 protein [Halotia branconii]|uniref:Glycosyltransferase family 2 protein n=1 Tax=Halotia branconii CENA392 TaxID=1539056 RepID=A0AAJ6NW22_9CYAN|nr:glycosyltransferase family 2 protein [Halotia branconii]WGV27799.1 glycosyltransferase family 2 protein [Halotia branconii CENA392]